MTFKSKLKNITKHRSSSKKQTRKLKKLRGQHAGAANLAAAAYEIPGTRYQNQVADIQKDKQELAKYQKVYTDPGFVGKKGAIQGAAKARNLLKKLVYPDDSLNTKDNLKTFNKETMPIGKLIKELQKLSKDLNANGNISESNIIHNIFHNLNDISGIDVTNNETPLKSIKDFFETKELEGIFDDAKQREEVIENLQSKLNYDKKSDSDFKDITIEDYNNFIKEHLDKPFTEEIFRGTSNLDLYLDAIPKQAYNEVRLKKNGFLEGTGRFKGLTSGKTNDKGEIEDGKGLLADDLRRQQKQKYAFGKEQKEKLIETQDKNVFFRLAQKYESNDGVTDPIFTEYHKLPTIKDITNKDSENEAGILDSLQDPSPKSKQIVEIDSVAENYAIMDVFDNTQGFYKDDTMTLYFDGRKIDYPIIDVINSLKTIWIEYIEARNKYITVINNVNTKVKEAYEKAKKKLFILRIVIANADKKINSKRETLDAKSGLGIFKKTKKMGIVSDRLNWCHQLEQLYLVKHSEIISLGLYISILLSHLYIIHYIFNQIIQIINVGKECPDVPGEVILPPSYQTIIQKYFRTQGNDIKFINQQMKKTLPIFNTLKDAVAGQTDDTVLTSGKIPVNPAPPLDNKWQPTKVTENEEKPIQAGGSGPEAGYRFDISKAESTTENPKQTPDKNFIKYGVSENIVRQLDNNDENKIMNNFMGNIKDSRDILRDIQESIKNINVALVARANAPKTDLYNDTVYKDYTELNDTLEKGAEFKYNNLRDWDHKISPKLKVKRKDVQNYLNNCHNLEKLYIRKHFEFVYLKNVYKKLLYFYLVIFVIFFYYINSINPSDITSCEDSGSSNYYIPKAFLKNVKQMVAEQKNIFAALQPPTIRERYNSPKTFSSQSAGGFLQKDEILDCTNEENKGKLSCQILEGQFKEDSYNTQLNNFLKDEQLNEQYKNALRTGNNTNEMLKEKKKGFEIYKESIQNKNTKKKQSGGADFGQNIGQILQNLVDNKTNIDIEELIKKTKSFHDQHSNEIEKEKKEKRIEQDRINQRIRVNEEIEVTVNKKMEDRARKEQEEKEAKERKEKEEEKERVRKELEEKEQQLKNDLEGDFNNLKVKLGEFYDSNIFDKVFKSLNIQSKNNFDKIKKINFIKLYIPQYYANKYNIKIQEDFMLDNTQDTLDTKEQILSFKSERDSIFETLHFDSIENKINEIKQHNKIKSIPQELHADFISNFNLMKTTIYKSKKNKKDESPLDIEKRLDTYYGLYLGLKDFSCFKEIDPKKLFTVSKNNLNALLDKSCNNLKEEWAVSEDLYSNDNWSMTYLDNIIEKLKQENTVNWSEVNKPDADDQAKWHIIEREFKEVYLGAARVIVYIRDSGRENGIKTLPTEDNNWSNPPCDTTKSTCGGLARTESGVIPSAPRDAMGVLLNTETGKKEERGKEALDANDTSNIVTPTRADDFLYMQDSENKDKKKVYGPFTSVYENTSTYDLYNGFSDLTTKLLNGKNVLIFGFGFSGSGKTYQLVAAENNNAIVKQYLRTIGTSDKVTSIELKFKELYPKTGAILEDGSVDTSQIEMIDNNALKAQAGITDDLVFTKKGGKNINNFIKSFTDANEKITDARILNLRITPTPNNPESSRSHIFYEFDITLNDDRSSKLVIVDMAGTENTIEIRKDFMNGLKDTDSFLNLNEGPIALKNIGTIKYNINEYGKIKWMSDLVAYLENPQEKYVQTRDIHKDTLVGKSEAKTDTKQNVIMKKVIYKNAGAATKEIIKLLTNSSKEGIQILEVSDSKVMHKVLNNFYSKLIGNTIKYGDTVTEIKWLGQSVKTKSQLTETELEQIYQSFKKLTKVDDANSIFSLLFRYHHNKLTSTAEDQANKFKIAFQNKIKEYYEKGSHIKSINITTDKLPFKLTVKIEDGNVEYQNAINLMLVYIIEAANQPGTTQKAVQAINNFKKVCLLSFMSNYINLVVDQGKGIVTTLEHIKYFFMHASMPNKRTIFDETTGYNYNSLGNWRNLGVKVNEKNPLNQSIMHTYPKPIEGTVQWSEERNVGNMQQYQILEELLTYSGNQNPTLTLGADDERCDPGTCPSEHVILNPGDGACFVMLALIKRGELKDGGYDRSVADKFKKASEETLELANILKSEPSKCTTYLKLMGSDCSTLDKNDPCIQQCKKPQQNNAGVSANTSESANAREGANASAGGGGFRITKKSRKLNYPKNLRSIIKRKLGNNNKKSKKLKKLSSHALVKIPNKLKKTLSQLGHTASWNRAKRGGPKKLKKRY